MKSSGKKGAVPNGGGAATLVIVIAGFIILYILFLPKGERDQLLQEGAVTTSISAGSLPGSTLVNENPGTLTKLKEKEFEHMLSSFNLFTKTEDSVLKSVDSARVESSRSGKSEKSVILAVKDKVENAKLTFDVDDHSGRLIITSNNDEIFSQEVNSFTEPISLDLEDENLVVFSTEPVPWWKPFSKNFYDLRNIKVTGTVQKVDNRESIQSVILGQEEVNLLRDASLTYYVDCNAQAVSRLAIYLNGGLLSSKVPDCGSLDMVQLDPSDLVTGKNEFKFLAETGIFFVDQIKLKTKLKEPIFPLYFFSINSSTFQRIENNTVNSTLSINFADDNERKAATIEINNQKTRLDTRAANYSKNVDSFLTAGTNFLRLIPETTLNIVQLKLTLDCRKSSDCS